MAIFITPSSLFSKMRYASSILLSGKRWVMRGVVSILPCSMSCSTSSQSHPSTTPVLNVRFLPYMSDSGSTCGSSYVPVYPAAHAHTPSVRRRCGSPVPIRRVARCSCSRSHACSRNILRRTSPRSPSRDRRLSVPSLPFLSLPLFPPSHVPR